MGKTHSLAVFIMAAVPTLNHFCPNAARLNQACAERRRRSASVFSVLNRIGFPSVLMGYAEAEGDVFIESVSKALNAIRGCRRAAAIAA